MIIVLKQDAPDVQVREFCHELEDMGLQINDSKGSDTHILGLIGDTKAIAESWVLANPVVETCRRVTEPYKKANRKFHPDDSVIDVDGVKIGGGNFAVIAGPCSIESEEQITYCAQRVKAAGASLLRGGAFKPRTSPYSFQGMRSDGPAVYYSAPGWRGSIGLIAAVHGKFCASCNRVRLTSQGFLRPCLASESGTDLRALLRSGADDAALLQAIQNTILAKPREHHFGQGSMPATRGMYRIGG